MNRPFPPGFGFGTPGGVSMADVLANPSVLVDATIRANDGWRMNAGGTVISWQSLTPTDFMSLTTEGALSAAVDATGNWTDFNVNGAGTPAGFIAGRYMTSLNIRLRQNPTFDILLRSRANPLAADTRVFVGWVNIGAAFVNQADISARNAVGVMFDTTAGDARATAFVPITANGAAQALGSAFPNIVANTEYFIQLRVNQTTGLLTAIINGVTRTLTMTANLDTGVGYRVRVGTSTSGVVDRFGFLVAALTWDVGRF